MITFSPDTIFAVRSSAVGEDSEDLSCAGQNLSVLGVKCKGVSSAVTRCWASLFSEHSVDYRRYAFNYTNCQLKLIIFQHHSSINLIVLKILGEMDNQ